MIGERINFLRRKKGLSISELAKQANLSKSYVSSIEKNKKNNPSIQVLEKIAKILQVDINTLLETETDTANSQTFNKQWVEMINELKNSKISREELNDYMTLVEFIKWKNNIKAHIKNGENC